MIKRIRVSGLLTCSLFCAGVCFGYFVTRLEMPRTDTFSEINITADSDTGSEINITVENQFSIVQRSEIEVQRNTSNTNYLVYDCSKQFAGGCGGWSDRVSGMLSLYVVAILTDKHFLIHHDNPCQLSNYLKPNKYDWQYDKKILNGNNHSLYNYLDQVPSEVESHSYSELQKLFPENVTFVRMNWDYTTHFRQIGHTWKLLPWINKLHIADKYAYFFNFLFKPSKTITKEIGKILKHRKRKLACAHIRIGRSGTMPDDLQRQDPKKLGEIWNFLKNMRKRNYDIFVATDADVIKSKAKNMFKKYLITTPGRIMHVDRTKNGNLCDGFRKSFLDFFLLIRCHELVITGSGFGLTAAYLNEIHDNLYCFQNGLFPCSRYTLDDYFPGQMLSPY